MNKYEIETVELKAPNLNRNDLAYAMKYRYACKNLTQLKRFPTTIGMRFLSPAD